MIRSSISWVLIKIAHIFYLIGHIFHSTSLLLSDTHPMEDSDLSEITEVEEDLPNFKKDRTYYNEDADQTFEVNKAEDNNLWITYDYLDHPIAHDRDLYRWKLDLGIIEPVEDTKSNDTE